MILMPTTAGGGWKPVKMFARIGWNFGRSVELRQPADQFLTSTLLRRRLGPGQNFSDRSAGALYVRHIEIHFQDSIDELVDSFQFR